MVTAGNLEMAAAIGENARLHVLDPGAINAQRHFVFALTSRGAGVATNTLAIIDDEAVVHKIILREGRKIDA
jgi:hypothetical protein